MAYDDTLAGRIRELVRGRRAVTERRMFGGVAFLYRTRMCCGVIGPDPVVRVADDEMASVMRRRHVRPMDFTGRPLRGLVYVAPPALRTTAALRAWIARGERFVQKTPTAAAGPRARRAQRRQRR